MNPIRILLVDDHYIVRMGLASSINLEPGLQVVAEAENATEAMELYQTHLPDLIILDWRLPDASGLDLLRSLRSRYPKAKVLILTAFDTEENVYKAFQAGAMGYLPKSSRRPELISAIHKIIQGQQAFGPDIALKLANRIRRPDLTRREMDVLDQLVKGNSNKEISSELKISENTVKLHLSHIMHKLGAKDRTHAASIALQRGLTEG
jgi:DNA-binding NarL/FixJ family response regulator